MNKAAIRLLLKTVVLAALVSSGRAQDTNVTIRAAGAPSFILKVPAGANVTSTDEHTVVQTTETTFHLWKLNVKTPDEALPRISEIIKGEFVNLKPSATNDLKILGGTARQVSGKGNEADDGDPGATEVVLFTAGKHVFAACAHGEFDDAARRSKVMLAMLKNAKLP
jgi:hypothetical protein